MFAAMLTGRKVAPQNNVKRSVIGGEKQVNDGMMPTSSQAWQRNSSSTSSE